MKKKYPGVPVVAYVNTSAAVKAESDICCTSSNVVKVVESLKEDTVICIPDRNLSAYAAKRTKKKIISWDGFCNVHQGHLDIEDVNKGTGGPPRCRARGPSGMPSRDPGHGGPDRKHLGHASVLQGVESQGIHHRHRGRHCSTASGKKARTRSSISFRTRWYAPT